LARASQFESDSKYLPDGVTTRLFSGQGEIAALTEILAQGEVNPTSVEQRIARGDLAILAMAGAELVGYSWATFKERWISEARATMVPHEGDVLMYDKRIMPRWRGKGLQFALSVAMQLPLSRLGYTRALVWVDSLNTRSLKNQRRLGRRKVAAIISSPAFGILRVRNYSADGRITIERREPS
jgi:predicted amino acid-binding ACT domain protein